MVINLNGTKKDIPVCFEELTTRQYEMLIPELAKDMENRDHFKIFNIIAGTNFSSYNVTSEIEVTIWNAIKWIYEQPFPLNEMPKVLTFKGNNITLPKNVKALSIGQNVALKQLVVKAQYLEENISSAVAIYLQPIIDGAKFNSERVDEIKKEVDQMSCVLIRPIGFFLLKSASTHGSGQMSYSKKMLNSLKLNSAGLLLNWRKLVSLTGIAT
jgi:hypothetical protein